MSHKLEGNKLIVELDLKSTTPTKTGNTIMLASSRGWIWEGDIGISYNIVRKPKE